MSPVSRGRKGKQGKKGKKRTSGRQGAARRGGDGSFPDASRSAFTAVESLLRPRQRPEWFDSSINAVLDRAAAVMAARGPRELEQAAAEALGGELHRIVHEERQGLWFDWWFAELAEAAAARIRERSASGDGGWQAPWRLLHGLASLGSPALRSAAQTAIGRAKQELRGEAAARQQPGWLGQLARIAATGEVWQMRDAYGAQPDSPAVGALAEEWMEGTLPDTWHAASPHRVQFQLALIGDGWVPDDPVTVAAKALMPEWVRWHGEQAGLPQHLIDRAVAVATGTVPAASDCASRPV